MDKLIEASMSPPKRFLRVGFTSDTCAGFTQAGAQSTGRWQMDLEARRNEETAPIPQQRPSHSYLPRGPDLTIRIRKLLPDNPTIRPIAGFVRLFYGDRSSTPQVLLPRCLVLFCQNALMISESIIWSDRRPLAQCGWHEQKALSSDIPDAWDFGSRNALTIAAENALKAASDARPALDKPPTNEWVAEDDLRWLPKRASNRP